MTLDVFQKKIISGYNRDLTNRFYKYLLRHGFSVAAKEDGKMQSDSAVEFLVDQFVSEEGLK